MIRFLLAAAVVSAFFTDCYAPIPPCSPLRFINTWVESDEMSWLLDGLPGHPVPPCPYEDASKAPLDEKSVLYFFLSQPQRIIDEMRREGYFWTNTGLSRLNERIWNLYDAAVGQISGLTDVTDPADSFAEEDAPVIDDYDYVYDTELEKRDLHSLAELSQDAEDASSKERAEEDIAVNTINRRKKRFVRLDIPGNPLSVIDNFFGGGVYQDTYDLAGRSMGVFLDSLAGGRRLITRNRPYNYEPPAFNDISATNSMPRRRPHLSRVRHLPEAGPVPF